MGLIEAQFISSWQNTLPRDLVCNTLHFRHAGGLDESIAELVGIEGVNWDATAAAWATAFASVYNGHNFTYGEGRGVECKIYDLADAKPRPVLGQGAVAPTADNSSTGNRAVALCLSFYGTRNLARQRGRMYTGPFAQGSAGKFKASGFETADCAQFPAVIGAMNGVVDAGPDVPLDWVVYSRKNATSYRVTNWWVDDEWDVQRRRAIRADSRVSGATGG